MKHPYLLQRRIKLKTKTIGFATTKYADGSFKIIPLEIEKEISVKY